MSINLKPHSLECGGNFGVLDFGASRKPQNKPPTLVCGKFKVFLMKKRGFELAISTIILIVLGLMVLFALLYLLNNQTGFFSEILSSVSGKSNVDLIITSCNSLANSQSFYEYCCEKKKITFSGDKQYFELSCNEFRQEKVSSSKIQELSCDNVNC